MTVSYVCGYCRKSFVKETSLAVHLCEPKRRRLEKDERGVQIGFQAFLRFYEIHQGSSRLRTYEDFCESAYYRAFVKFGRYCVAVLVINPPRFVDWLLQNNVKIDRWCRDSVYTQYHVQHLQKEAVADALARAIEHSINWSETTGHPSRDVLRYGNHNAICHAITSGKLSAWVIYNSASGQQFLSELTADLVSLIWPYVDSDVWLKKFQAYPADQEYAKEILKQAGW